MAYIYYAKPDIVDCKYSNLFVFIINQGELNLSDCKLQQTFVQRGGEVGAGGQ